MSRKSPASAPATTGADPRRARVLLTPEGVPLTFTLAARGDRLVALGLDLLIVVGAPILLFVLIYFGLAALYGGGLEWSLALVLLVVFLFRTFYFTLFELRWQGQTPGKRKVGLRVVDRRGGPLTGDAIFVRNVTRELELFVPLAALTQPEALYPGSAGLGALFAILWLLVLACLPLWNRDSLRLGDLAAGTMVVETPKAVLLDDLASAPEAPARPFALRPAEAPEVTFTSEQLDHYGIYELQVLEDLLRRDDPDPEALAVVAGKVQRKIGWDPAAAIPPEPFLRAFYKAQRARLEHKLLLGQRQERKRA